MSKKVIGIDLGGSNIRAAIVEPDGSIDGRIHVPTPKTLDAGQMADMVAKLVDELQGQNGASSIGLAIAAVVDAKRNRIVTSPNLSQLNDFDFAKELGDRAGLDVVLENDATAAAIGEHWLGAGKGSENMICVTLGTGVGGGLIIEGEPVYGADGNAGEIGHICLDADGPPCGCGSNGCLEQYSSGTAIVRLTRELLANSPESSLHSHLEFTSQDVSAAAMQGDHAATEAFKIAGKRLGMGLAGLVNLLNPEVIVIAGGVANSWDLFIGAAREELAKRAFQQPAERVKIVRGTLGDDAGVLGAAKRAFSNKGFS